MQLSLHADYSLRVLIYLGTHRGEVVTTAHISEAYGISRNHLVRVMHTLGEHGYIDLLPGRSGGVRLKRDPKEIRLGQVVRDAEPNMRLVECFDMQTNTCPIAAVCGLQKHLASALHAFLRELDKFTLDELLTPQRQKALAAVFVQVLPAK
ncbi:MAG: Rrf2 family transcriptional regulator [Bryobacterales bacterium]|nr:Rrf2 family transcriptional regulator [Bryobacterales bacterium]